MVSIGKMNQHRVVKELDFGIYFDGEELGEILMPKRYVPEGCKIDDVLDVFIYRDSEDRVIATTEKPHAMVGDFAFLKVVEVNEIGAFLDLGLTKDVLVPFREQKQPMEANRWYVVKLYLDDISKRIAASTKLDSFLDNIPPDYKIEQEVDLLVCKETSLGYKAIVNGSHWGLIYKNEIFTPLRIGQSLKGFIKSIREDEKIDISLQKAGFEKIADVSERIMDCLRKAGGFIEVTDKSSPEAIQGLFGISKKTYKSAIGTLYRRRLVELEDKGIRLIEEEGD